MTERDRYEVYPPAYRYGPSVRWGFNIESQELVAVVSDCRTCTFDE